MSELNYEIVAKNIRAELKAYLQKSGLKAIVLGISGGIDSTLCAALAKPVCDELGVELIGRSITIESNKQDERHRADEVGNIFCTDYKEVGLTGEYMAIAKGVELREGTFEKTIGFADKIRRGNIKARMRMIYLYNIAQLKSGMVLSTDNYTEFLLGFWTLHGDVGDYGMVQNLWKTEVYGLSRWIAENESEQDARVYSAMMHGVNAVPTDGLGITDSDLDQLGAKTYAEVDTIIQRYLELKGIEDSDDGQSDRSPLPEILEEEMNKLAQHPVIKRYYATMFKRENPYNLPRDIVCEGAE